jgi:hypothetical protein
MFTRIVFVQPLESFIVAEKEPAGEETCEDECQIAGKVCCGDAKPGFQANGQVIAAVGALIQKAVAAAPALIAELQTLAPEIEALIALFGKTPSNAS